jgi:hypothetical protein
MKERQMTTSAAAPQDAVADVPPVTVSRRISAPASAVFAILADPRRHTEIDGTGMLRGAVTQAPVTGVGDVFVLNMYFHEFGDYQMASVVVEFEPGRRITWEPHRHDIEEPVWHHRWGYVLDPDGGDTVVTEVFDCSRAPQDAREGMQGGQIWVPGMTKTLERLGEVLA